MLCRKIFLSRGNNILSLCSLNLQNNFHTSSVTCGVRNPAQNKIIKAHSKYYDDAWSKDLEEWTDRNKMLFPPTAPGDPIRPAEIHHGRAFIRHSPKKMLLASKTIRRMNVDEAIAQLNFVEYKAAKIIIEVLKEAQELAVSEFNVEFKSNLHIAESIAFPSGCNKIPIYHGRGIMNIARSRFSHFYVLLREGPAPEHKPAVTAYGAAMEHLNMLRSRTIAHGL